ncbi:MAG TPA: methyltransferase domain-containing protein [Candidatus Manganitrophaceae bacterium]
MDSHASSEPSALIIEHLPRFPKGRALDIATGYGRNALYLAAHGYDVEALDRDEAGLAFIRAEAEKHRLPCVATAVDLEGEKPLPGRDYALISCFYYLDRKLIPHIKEALKKGGVLVYETFLIDQHERFGKPARREFCWGHNELLRLFLDSRILFYFEGFKEERWIVQLIAERI